MDARRLKWIIAVRRVTGIRWLPLAAWGLFWTLFLILDTALDWNMPTGRYSLAIIVAGVLGLLPTMILDWWLLEASERIARRRLGAAEPYYINAESFCELGDYDLALVEYDIVIDYDPDNARAYTGRANIYELKGEHDLAIADCTTAIKMDRRIRGLARRKSMGYDAGDYDLAWAYYYRGCAYRSKDEIELAKSDFESAIAVNHAGFPRAFTYNQLLTIQPDGSDDPGIYYHSELVDANTVHYIKPCDAVGGNAGLTFLYSRYYLAVTCDACLKSRRSVGSTPRAGYLVLYGFVLALLPTFVLGSRASEILFNVVIPLTVIGIGAALVLDNPDKKIMFKTVKPIAARFLVRRFGETS